MGQHSSLPCQLSGLIGTRTLHEITRICGMLQRPERLSEGNENS